MLVGAPFSVDAQSILLQPLLDMRRLCVVRIVGVPTAAQIFLGLDFAEAKQLSRVDLSKNMLPEVPVQLGFVATLKQLNLTDNQLKTLPFSLRNLRDDCRVILDGSPFPSLTP